MINFTTMGAAVKLGLNLYRAPGGFVAIWAWYDFASHKATIRRLRIRLHMSPRILRSVETFSVIDNYLKHHDLELIHRERLVDLHEIEEDVKRINEPLSYVKPGA